MNHSVAIFAGCFCLALSCAATLPAQTARPSAEKNAQSAEPDALSAEPKGTSPGVQPASAAESPQQADREQQFADYLSGTTFLGQFTVDGQPDMQPKSEEYTILDCQKLPAENMYRFTTRIKYGDVDSEVPMELRVLWSGNTPVITLDDLWIPTMGTFSARVLIHADRYAGTWQHGDAGGHLFGKIEKKVDSGQ